MTETTEKLVFLLDVDNTLLDNDHIQDDLHQQLTEKLGAAESDRYWKVFESLRDTTGYADYLAALQQLRLPGVNDLQLLELSTFMLDYPFPERVYAGALKALKHLSQWGPTVILSDGDVVFQPHKIHNSGLWQAVESRVLIYIHKEKMLEQVERAWPSHHYVMVDDKLRLLTAMKEIWRDRLTTIFVRQGHYGRDDHANASYPPPDLTLDGIAQLIDHQPPFRT